MQTTITATTKYCNVFSTLRGRIQYINVFIYSKLYYFLQIIPLPITLLAAINILGILIGLDIRFV